MENISDNIRALILHYFDVCGYLEIEELKRLLRVDYPEEMKNEFFLQLMDTIYNLEISKLRLNNMYKKREFPLDDKLTN